MSRRSWAVIGLGLALLGWLLAPPAQAVEVVLSAEYRGESTEAFRDTTPPTPACAFFPYWCTTYRTVYTPLSYTKLTKVSGSLREQFYLRLPGPRAGQVTHTQTGDSQAIGLEIFGVSQQVSSPTPSRNPANSRDRVSGSNCQPQPGQWGSTNEFNSRWFFWDFPGVCATRPERFSPGQQETVQTSSFSVFYKLTLPSTMRMKPGRYEGRITYTVGAGADIDFGDDVTGLSDHELTFLVVLDIEHSFRVEFAPNTDRTVLEPPGGWTGWIEGGRVPTKLSDDLALRVWSSGPFRVYKLCEYDVGDRCGIRNARGETAPVQVAVTMPWGIRYQGGWQSINRVPLGTGRSRALLLEGQNFTANGPGLLHFDIAQADLKPMLARPGEPYAGKVTVIFDAEL